VRLSLVYKFDMSLKISQCTIQQTQNDALKAYKNGKSVESCGLILQLYHPLTVAPEDSSLIRKYGLGIKYNAGKSFQFLELLKSQDENSINLYCLSVQAYTNAVQTHIEAMKLYLSITQKHIQKINESIKMQ
jgi:hypothetical protein